MFWYFGMIIYGKIKSFVKGHRHNESDLKHPHQWSERLALCHNHMPVVSEATYHTATTLGRLGQ